MSPSVVSRILITGGSGYLGRHMVPRAAEDHEVCCTFHRNDPGRAVRTECLDIRDGQAVRSLVEDFRPHVIIHTAGSDASPDCDDVIRRGTAHIVDAARSASARLIHLSTDVIFDGRRAPYDEDAPPSPIHAYGRAKASAEASVRQHPDHIIIRTSLIYGLDIMDRATAGLATALRSGQPVTLFTDQRRNPVWVETLSSACVELAEKEITGVLNVAGRQVLTRAELGTRLLDWWRVITERQTLSLGPSDGNKWPKDCELDLTRAKKLLSTPLLGVDEVVGGARRN